MPAARRAASSNRHPADRGLSEPQRTGYDSLVALAERVADRPWLSRFLRAAVPAREARHWDGWRAMLVVDPRDHYAGLRIPTLVVLGERDDRILIDKHRAVFDSLARSGSARTRHGAQ